MKDRNRALQTRIETFVINCISLSTLLDKTVSNSRIVPQFIDSSTSVGANYNEACEAESSKDFIHKLRIAKKEARETNYWLRLIKNTDSTKFSTLNSLEIESEELIKIFSSIISKFNPQNLVAGKEELS